MIAHKKDRKKYNKPIAPLYALVYGTRSISAVVFLLLIGFILQPVQQVYAANDTVAQESAPITPIEEVVNQSLASDVMVEDAKILTDEEVSEVSSEELVAPEEVGEISQTEPISDLTSSTTSVEIENSSLESGGVVTDTLLEGEIGDETLLSIENNVTVIDESTTTVNIQEVQNDVGSSSIEIVTNENILTTESTTSSSEEMVLNVNEKVNTENIVSPVYSTNENEYTFDKNQCVSVGEGTYHCATNNSQISDKQEQVFSEKGALGNFEIFIRTSTGVEQITDNYFDDLAPEYDIKSQRLVWQRLIEGRYQIVVYDLKQKTETIITSGATNNMEPTISGDNIAWQQWDGNDWEIVLYSKTGFIQITKNDSQDIGPVIEDNFIIWTAIGAESQLAQVYSLETGATQAITDYEGGAIKNPRFILVYDTKFDNGDVVTRGFDPKTGLSTSLAAVPAPVPIDIPPPDSTGETRALIQNKSASREDFSDLDSLDPLNNKTGSSSDTVNIEGSDNQLIITPVAEASSTVPFSLTEYDLLVTPYENSTTSTQLVDSDTN